MTPVEKHGFQVGMTFIVRGSPRLADGTILKLCEDDGTDNPMFMTLDGRAPIYCHLSYLTPTENQDCLDAEDCQKISSDRREYFGINGVKLRDPLRSIPQHGSIVYVANPLFPAYCSQMVWEGSETQLILFYRGLLHLDESSAVEHAMAIVRASSLSKKPLVTFIKDLPEIDMQEF